MEAQDIKDEWPRLEENDPPLDLSREEATYQREHARLVRDHLGQIVLIRFDEVVGVYATPAEALAEGFRRFGDARWICRPITEKDEPEFIPHVDINHPAFRRID
jgi:hypothetical protein